MSTQALLAPPAVFQLSPPYDQFEAVSDLVALSPEQLPHAALLAVGVVSPDETWSDVASLVHQLRMRFPAAPVILRAGRPGDEGDTDLARRAAAVHARAVVFEGDPLRPTLRRALTDQTNLADDIAEWFTLRSPGVQPAVLALVTEVLRLAPRFGEVSALLGSLGHAERTVRTWFRRAGVPGPGKWLAVAHATRAALRMQAEPSAPLLALAVECGYSDHSSLSRQCLRLFGTRPGRIRGMLGWEWLMDQWLRRAARTERAAKIDE